LDWLIATPSLLFDAIATSECNGLHLQTKLQ
jgi:hypothetical protein